MERMQFLLVVRRPTPSVDARNEEPPEKSKETAPKDPINRKPNISSNSPSPFKRESSISSSKPLQIKRELSISPNLIQPTKPIESKREAMEKTTGYQTIIIQLNGEKETFHEVSGWRIVGV